MYNIQLVLGSLQRRQEIEAIRKEGDFLFNTNSIYSNNDSLVTCRTLKNINIKYEVCGYCKGFYSKRSLRKHIPNCNKNDKSNKTNAQIFGRSTRSNIHEVANEILKKQVFPVLTEDAITNIIRYDKLVIVYGNKMCEKYRQNHHHYMIRSKLRLIGRLLINAREIDKDIKDLTSLLHPRYFDTVILAVNKVAQLQTDGRYKAPSTAFSLSTVLKKCTKILVTECIKQQNHDLKQISEDFLKIWKDLASYTLIGIQVFNRRRAGELERLLIQDFNNRQTVDSQNHSDVFKILSDKEKQSMKEFFRITLRGKLGRQVAILIDREILSCIITILKYRTVARVPEDNPYVFGLPGDNKYLRACQLLRQYSTQCEAINPEILRGTYSSCCPRYYAYVAVTELCPRKCRRQLHRNY
ncbi:hypothetical protein FQR65_LT13424 [Abscondita terminalis]|nr:hypothetical protein FQR65_LT13424 [Abscondita terminalis]